MLIIDRFAYTNKFSNSNPYVKVVSSLALIIVSITNSSIYILCAMIAGIILTTVIGARIPKKSYLKMISVPVVYLIISILTVIFTFGFSDEVSHSFIYYKQFKFLNFYIGLTEGSVKNGFILGLRSLSGITSMYFLILTTPCMQQIKVMKKFKVSVVFIELYVLTYRFIAVFLEETILIHNAQKMRFGYNNYKNSINSLAVLVEVLFVRIMSRYKDMQSILEIKHFDGNFYTD